MTDTHDIAKLATDLAAAQIAHREAKQAASIARNAETAALNLLNDAQKKMDDAYAALRKNANQGSDWAIRRHAKAGLSND